MNEVRGHRLMGGNFGLSSEIISGGGCPAFLGAGDICMINGRSCIWLVLERLKPSCVWMPSYVCESMLDAVAGTAAKLKFFPINYDLKIESTEWIGDVRRGDLVVFIDYFGIPFSAEIAERVSERGAWVMEDACQALLNESHDPHAHFVLYSPRKFLGVPDGGILSVNDGIDLGDIKLTPVHDEWWLKSLMATVLRREFDIYGGQKQWFDLFQQVKRSHPIGPHAMSEMSRALLTYGFDYDAIARRRINNYNILADKLGMIALERNLPASVVPLGFPVRLKNRDAVQQELFRHEIFPPIHWPLPDKVPREYGASRRLVSEIMTLPCDQRYGESDMRRMINVISGVATC